MKIGFVGLGLMGAPMATNLVRAGNDVVVHGRNAETVARICDEGAHAAASLREIASQVDVLCSCRVTPQHSLDVFLSLYPSPRFVILRGIKTYNSTTPLKIVRIQQTIRLKQVRTQSFTPACWI